ncbi:hypothetical protein F4680DRAFT_427946 [Xylaria scruposa]|nr:hypothetical protein F4680DRAFT_427946 [Xylaria scruposa]
MPLCNRSKQSQKGHSYKLGPLRTTTCDFCSIVYQGICSVSSLIIPNDRYDVSLPPFRPRRGRDFHYAIVSFWCSWGTTCPWGQL